MEVVSFCTLFDETERGLMLEAVEFKRKFHQQQADRLSARSVISEAAREHAFKTEVLAELESKLIIESI